MSLAIKNDPSTTMLQNWNHSSTVTLPKGPITQKPDTTNLDPGQGKLLEKQWEMQERSTKASFMTNMMQMSFQTIMGIIRNIRGA
jgi:hypothetical protein